MQGDSEKHYHVKVGNYKFNISVYVKDQRGIYQQYTVYVGGTKKGCVEITGSTEPIDEMYKRIIDHTKAYISHVTYAKTCSLEKELEKGLGTRIMLKLALSFVKKHFNVAEFCLQDASNFACNNRWISLAHYSIALYGKTWYERYFNARLPQDKIYKKYRQDISYFSSPDKKTSIEAFIQVYAKDQENDQLFIKLFNESKTYNEFFQSLHKQHVNFCEVTYKWLSDFVKHQVNVPDHWVITDIPEIDGWSEQVLTEAPKYNIERVGGSKMQDNADLIDWRHP